ncbi:MAG TPA: Na(+)/H(+) antiporter subunit D [Syntrophorhabdaceae bacterium]|jgi:multicomponent Na+:H+ antiporter subunit D|nr:Na(+)/H(+) antiporter subunit D [Syntrophorhabdaceae bacterium]MDI9562027.1 Na(+)/H(+) antiporter subunit D [Pseudomonadota bacterium]MBV6506331.1 NAD(P)H-quinone oxidoreductase subunit 2, chloroplastic [Syntrophorhabdaceae bacterium]HNQ63397.1 Na(+)/H(+) antiporter subunit D [Syntrophorhabdaceae bacterium]HNZ59206.1 Na(+)/H(+) antiporter subunit D [Syntrophorhabdaceae bacterium]
MDSWIHPAFFFFLGSLLLPFIKGNAKKFIILLIPVLSIIDVALMREGVYGSFNFIGTTVVFGRVDKLSMVFAWVFTIMAFLGSLYALHVKEDGHHAAGNFYVGGSLGAIFAGDYLTLFIFWEIMAFSSVFLVWYRKEKRSIEAGYRYLLVHVFGGLCLFTGMMLYAYKTGSFVFDSIGQSGAGIPEYLILAGFALNAAVIPLHAWLPDAYPEATVEGAVFMCAFTTKTAVYVLARGFSGFEILAILGTAMTVYGVFYAVIENNIRRVLAYHIVSQVGYMVAGVGIGTELAINGACAHAFAHILYKALLFMGAGAILYMTGTAKLSRLGGLYKYMPLTMIFYIVGAISISGFPLFSGFVSKSMIVASAHEKGRLMLLTFMNLAGIGTFLSVGLKVTYFAFFGKEAPIKAKEPPKNMLWAMGLTSALCFIIGVYPDSLYVLLPYPVEYHPYTLMHLSEMLQILSFTGLVFFLLVKKLAPEDKLNLDLDIFYRMGGRVFMWIDNYIISVIDGFWGELYRILGLKILFKNADISYGFDRKVIDGVVDGSALGVRGFGGIIKKLQTGRIQAYMGFAVLFIVLIVWLLIRGM